MPACHPRYSTPPPCGDPDGKPLTVSTLCPTSADAWPASSTASRPVAGQASHHLQSPVRYSSTQPGSDAPLLRAVITNSQLSNSRISRPVHVISGSQYTPALPLVPESPEFMTPLTLELDRIPSIPCRSRLDAEFMPNSGIMAEFWPSAGRPLGRLGGEDAIPTLAAAPASGRSTLRMANAIRAAWSLVRLAGAACTPEPNRIKKKKARPAEGFRCCCSCCCCCCCCSAVLSGGLCAAVV